MERNENDRKRLLNSLKLTTAFWMALLVALIVIPLSSPSVPERKYSEIKLTLAAPAAPAAAARASSSTASVRTTQSSRATRPSPTAPSTSKNAPESGSVSALGIPNFSAPASQSRSDTAASEYLDFSSAQSTVNPRTSAGQVSEFEGTAGTVAQNSTSAARVTGGQRTASGTASSSTLSALDTISGQATTGTTTSTTGTAASGSGTAVTSTTTSNVGPLSFDGTPRRLIEPLEPAITLPPELAKQVDTARLVTVEFTVRPDGTVPGSLIFFTPSASLPRAVQDYLRSEFSRWKFSTGNSNGQARFQYSIKVQ